MSLQSMPSAPRVRARVVSAPPSVDALLEWTRDDATGGIAVFLGLVRDHDGGRSVQRLAYSPHPTAEGRLRAVAEAVAARHDVRAVAADHRVGALAIGDVAVVVVVGAAHRGPALEACRDLIDTLKAEVPIWKEQHFSGGRVEWVGLP